jgi:NAD(P)-dependent dehydrogenase (short-subunit alcohol dehydrogenase family)
MLLENKVEALSRVLAAELGPQGIRVVCLGPDATPETATIRGVFRLHANVLGITREDFQAPWRAMMLRKRLPTEANVAAFIAPRSRQIDDGGRRQPEWRHDRGPVS